MLFDAFVTPTERVVDKIFLVFKKITTKPPLKLDQALFLIQLIASPPEFDKNPLVVPTFNLTLGDGGTNKDASEGETYSTHISEGNNHLSDYDVVNGFYKFAVEVSAEDVEAIDFDDITTINIEAIQSLLSHSRRINHLIGPECQRVYVFN